MQAQEVYQPPPPPAADNPNPFTGNAAPPPPPAASQPQANPFDNPYNNGFDENGGYDAPQPPAQPSANTYANNDPYASNDSYGQNQNPNQPQQQEKMQSFQIQNNGDPENPEDGKVKAWSLSKYMSFLPASGFNVTAGVGLAVAGVLDFLNEVTGTDIFINCFLIVAGLVLAVLEVGRTGATACIVDAMLKWIKLLERLWGRGLAFWIVGILAVADTESTLKTVFGIVALVTTFVDYFHGWLAANKLKKLNAFVSAGEEGDVREQLIINKFDELNSKLQQGFLSKDHIVLIGQQADLDLNRTETGTLVRYFDEEFKGQIRKEDWLRGFENVEAGGMRFL